MYEGRADLEPDMVPAHENLGIVADAADAVVEHEKKSTGMWRP